MPKKGSRRRRRRLSLVPSPKPCFPAGCPSQSIPNLPPLAEQTGCLGRFGADGFADVSAAAPRSRAGWAAGGRRVHRHREFASCRQSPPRVSDLVAALRAVQPTIQVHRVLPAACCSCSVSAGPFLPDLTYCPPLLPLRALCSHVNGLALALLLGVDGAILPPAICRATFNTTLEHLADDALWSPQPLGTLLDVRKMQAHWREQHSMDVQEVLCVLGGTGR